MNHILQPRIWPSFSARCRLYPPERSPLRDGVEPEAGRPRVSHLATYRSGTVQIQHPTVARWPAHVHGLATGIHETSGLDQVELEETRLLFR